jgi:predicted aldo/keto reductase-like oxidoreductase
MQYREDKKTGNKLSILGFGCMRLPHKGAGIDIDKTEALIMSAISAGVNYFDTAYVYGGSEEALGTVLARNPGARDKIFIASKLPLINLKAKEDIDKFFNQELKRLQTDHIDYYLMHMLANPGQWEKLKAWGIEDWIAQKKASGAIRRVGFSFHGSRADFSALLKAYPWEFCQIQYNYSDPNYQAGVEGLKEAAGMGLPVIIMEPLLGGKLATGLPSDALKIFEADNARLSPAARGLRWIWNQEEPTVILSGMNSPEQLADNINAAENAVPGMLSPEELALYDKARDVIRASYKIPCTGCNYCMPCPQGVNIPGCFAAYNAKASLGFMAGMQQYWTSVHPTSPEAGRPSQCIACGRCEKHCPQHLPIIENLKKVRRGMEFWPVGPGVNLVRKITGWDKK